jgi:hypothetical protein
MELGFQIMRGNILLLGITQIHKFLYFKNCSKQPA